ncbi:glycosyl hydrolase family 95 catalytic domain-containing protein, partial [Mycoplasmopsis alligatoris]
HSLVWQLYEDTINAANELGLDQDIVSKWQKNQKDLKGPIEIGSLGNIKEWYEVDELNKSHHEFNHRHISHMLGVFPGDLISPDTPELFKAARVSMEKRTSESTGWGMGQRINTWARLRDGNKAHQLIANLFRFGILPNLWDTHPPFQIDGNFGMTSGVIQMLMQSNLGYISLLPALPNAWPAGKIDGLKARGNFEISMSWKNKKIDTLSIKSYKGEDLILELNSKYETIEIVDSNKNKVDVPVTAKFEGKSSNNKQKLFSFDENDSKLLGSDETKFQFLNKYYRFSHEGWNVVELVQNPSTKTWRLYMGKIEENKSTTIVQMNLTWEGNQLMAQKDWTGTKSNVKLDDLEKYKNNLSNVLDGGTKTPDKETSINSLKVTKLILKEKEIQTTAKFEEPKADQSNTFIPLFTLKEEEISSKMNFQDKFLYLLKNYEFKHDGYDVVSLIQNNRKWRLYLAKSNIDTKKVDVVQLNLTFDTDSNVLKAKKDWTETYNLKPSEELIKNKYDFFKKLTGNSRVTNKIDINHLKIYKLEI